MADGYEFARAFSKARIRRLDESSKIQSSDFYNFFQYQYSARLSNALIYCDTRYGEITIKNLLKTTGLERSTIYNYLEYCVE